MLKTAGGYESMITKYISELVSYGKANGLIEECDEIYVTNRRRSVKIQKRNMRLHHSDRFMRYLKI